MNQVKLSVAPSDRMLGYDPLMIGAAGGTGAVEAAPALAFAAPQAAHLKPALPHR